MEPPRGIGASLWNFICFLPYFIGLLLLGLIKGIILCPLICLIMTTGNSAIILGLWPVHCLWTYYCILSTKQFGIVLKLVLCICIIVPLLLWPLISIVGSIIGGAAFGLLSPIFATFDAVGEGKDDVFFHCIYDGTWETVTGCFTIVRDFGDVCYHSYFSIMDDLRGQGNYYEIRLMYIPGAILIGALGILVDYVVISLVAICKFPYMLFKGWHRLFQDCIGREGPFLETICVPIAGLAILLWPLAVVGALLASVLSSIILGAYAAVIVYQESSLWLGLCYIVASLSIYDEYSNDVLDMPEGSCFPRPQYRKKTSNSGGSSREGSLRKPDSFRKVPSRSVSIKTPLVEVKPLEAEEEETEAMMTMMGAVHLHRRRQRENRISRHGGSIMNHRVIDRNREDGHNRLYHDYFSDTPTYTETQFRRRFRMRRPLFLRIEEAITAHDTYFIQRIDAVGARGLSSLQKMTAAVRMLAYGTAADAVDDYVRIGESTAIESLKRFVKAVVEIFGPEYLRRPNDADVARLLAENEERGFPGMLGSIDCMHWKWKNCPTGWQGMYTGHVHEPTIILEAIASKDLWIWHSFFGLPGSLNDINVLDRSHLFEDLAEGRGPEVRYTINGHEYNMGYYLADGIYPSWPTFVKTIPKPQGNKRKYFAIAQESTRKDVERAFGVLQARFAMIRGPSRFWDVGTMKYIMTACIILHNMIVEDERELPIEEENCDTNGEIPFVTPSRSRPNDVREFIQVHQQIRDKQVHLQLQNDLVEHLWQIHGGDIN